jgi:flagellar assembly factor FliW
VTPAVLHDALRGGAATIPATPDDRAMSVAIAPMSMHAVSTRLFGDLEVAEQAIHHFADGLLGFEQHTSFALLPAMRDGLWWLQSLDAPALSFLLVDPFVVAPGYEVDVSPGDARSVGLASPDDALVLAIAVLPATAGGAATCNLRAPLLFNLRERRGRQVVSRVEAHGLMVPVDLSSLPPRADGLAPMPITAG